MGAAIYFVLETELPGFDASSINGKVLNRALPQLNGICRDGGFSQPLDFFSMDPEEATVQRLLDAIRSDPSRIQNVSVENVIQDLVDAERLLIAAREPGVRFHVAVDY